MLTILGFFSSALLIAAYIQLGERKRYAFLVGLAANLIYLYVIAHRTPLQFDLLALNAIFAFLSIRNYIMWSPIGNEK